ncbi:MAG TPA: hypothetical protein VIG34_04235 [Xanthobacteraceae bacterium]|jgi:hypothetical protein
MSLAKFASLHGGLLARKGKATPATVHHGIDFVASKIDGRSVGVINGHELSFEAELLTPESGSHKETEPPAVTAAVPELDEHFSEPDGPRLPALVVEPEAAVERSQLDQDQPLEQAERRADEPWDGSERRKVDRGLAPGTSERRKPPVFGKRGAARTLLSEMNQKRFNA